MGCGERVVEFIPLMNEATSVNNHFEMTKTTDIKRQFLNSLKRGTGEAYFIVKDNPQIDFSNQIIKGVLNIFAYDGQSEVERANYIFDIISVSKQQDKIRKAVLHGLASEQEGPWDLTHLFALAKHFAEQGDNEMKDAIYDRFCNNPIEGCDWAGYSEILDLDGLQGLIYIAEKFGKAIEQNPDDWQDDFIIKEFQEENPNLKVLKTLENQAKENKHIRIYLDNIKRTKANRKKHKSKPIIFKDIIDEVFNSKPFILFRRKENLSDDELIKIANQLINESEESKIEKLLDVFDDNKFPLDSKIILNFAKQKRSSKNRVVDNAIAALKHLKSKSIRAFALDKIINSKNPLDYLEILTSNYQNGDFKLLYEIAVKTFDEHKIERLAGIYTDIYTANKTKECKEPLEVLYSKMNCGIHRNGIVEILIENDVLSEKIKNEIKFDSYLGTRELIK